MEVDTKEVIKRLRELPNEEEVMVKYREFLETVEEEIRSIQGEEKGTKVKEAVGVAKEAARRVASPRERYFIFASTRKLAKESGVEPGVIGLPPYEGDRVWIKKWEDGDSERLKDYIKKIFTVLNELRNEHIEKWVTVDEICQLTCEASFIVEFILEQLEKTGILEFEHIALRESGEIITERIIHLKEEFPVEEDAISELLKKLQGTAEIPRHIVQLLPKNRLYR